MEADGGDKVSCRVLALKEGGFQRGSAQQRGSKRDFERAGAAGEGKGEL